VLEGVVGCEWFLGTLLGPEGAVTLTRGPLVERAYLVVGAVEPADFVRLGAGFIHLLPVT
jgi:hypothetical protein